MRPYTRLGTPGAPRDFFCTRKRTFESPHVGGATFGVRALFAMILGALERYESPLAIKKIIEKVGNFLIENDFEIFLRSEKSEIFIRNVNY